MSAQEPLDMARYTNTITKKGGVQGVMHISDVNTTLQRLVDIGLITKTEGTNTYVKSVRSGSPGAIKILKNYGKVLGVEGGSDANRWVGDLPEMSHVVDTIVYLENPITRNLAMRFGINPSAGATTPLQKAAIAYVRQQSSKEILVEVALQAALDSHAIRGVGPRILGKKVIPFVGTGRMPVKIDADGIVEDTGTFWMDVFSDPDAFKSVLSPEARAYIDDYKELAVELERLRLRNGLESLAEDWGGLFYIPRQVIGEADIKFINRSKPHEERKYVTATQGRTGWVDEKVGYQKETKYMTDPRENMRIHLLQGYEEILKDKLSDFIVDSGMAFTKTELLAKLDPKLATRYANAVKSLRGAKQKIKRLESDLINIEIPKESRGTYLQSIEETARERRAIQAELKKTKALREKFEAEVEKTKKKRNESIENIKNKRSKEGTLSVSGKFWGEVGNEDIAVQDWMGKFFRNEDYKALEAGVKALGGDTSGWTRAIGNAVNVSRWLSANADFGVGQIHGLPILARDPRIWAKAMLHQFEAFLDPAAQARYVRQNIGTFKEMAQYRVPLGDVEFFRAMEQGRGLPVGKLVTILPEEEGSELFGHVVGGNIAKAGRVGASLRRGGQATIDQSMGRFQSGYNYFLAMSRSLMWKGMKDSWLRAETGGTLDELGAYVRNMTGALDVKALGVSPDQREIEGIWMAFSPRLLRSTIALVSDALSYVPAKGGKIVGVGEGPTMRQKESARTMANFITGVHGIYVTAAVSSGMAKGHSWDRIMQDIQEGVNPLSGGRYLSIQVDGQWYGVGGQIRALTQLLMAVTASLAPDDLLPGPMGAPISDLWALNTMDNPLVRFMAYRGGKGPQWLKTIIEGVSKEKGFPLVGGTDINALAFENVDGLVDIPVHVGEDSLPLSLIHI